MATTKKTTDKATKDETKTSAQEIEWTNQDVEHLAESHGVPVDKVLDHLGIPKSALKKVQAKPRVRYLEYEDEEEAFVEKGIVAEGEEALGMIIETAENKLKAMEKFVDVRKPINAYPTDALYALHKAFKVIFGDVLLKGDPNWFGGEDPPEVLDIPIGLDKSFKVPYCRMSPPSWEGGWMEAQVTSPMQCHLHAGLKKKHVPQIDEIVALAEKFLHEESIFKGVPTAWDFEFLRKKRDFDFLRDGPIFMDVSSFKKDDLILDKATDAEMDFHLWSRIERTELIKALGNRIRYTLLAYGPYGSGKSLCASVAAKVCEDNGWSFMYVKYASGLGTALDIARLYEPCMIFVEDVDTLLSQERSEELNDVLNKMSGVAVSKNEELVMMFSSNHAERLPEVAKRQHRIDWPIYFGYPNEEQAAIAMGRLLKEQLVKGCDLTESAKLLVGMPMSNLDTAASYAKTHAAMDVYPDYNEGDDINLDGKVKAIHVEKAAAQVRKAYEFQKSEQEDPTPKKIHEGIRGVIDACGGVQNLITPFGVQTDQLIEMASAFCDKFGVPFDVSTLSKK